MRIIPVLLIAAATLPAAASNIYKWTDAQGQVHYSQTPPPSGAVSAQSQTRVQPGVSLDTPPAPAAAAKPAKTKPAAVAETAEAKAKRCTAARERQAFLASTIPRRLMVLGADGSESRMTEEQYAESIAKAQEAGKGC